MKTLLLWCLLPISIYAQTLTIQWEKRFGSTEKKEIARGLTLTADGGCVVVGTTKANKAGGDKTTDGFGGSDIWIIKVDAQGKKQWDFTYGSPGNDVANVVVSVEDGFLIGASTEKSAGASKKTEGFGEKDFWLLKLDAKGVLQWEKSYGGAHTDELRDIEVTKEGYLLGGRCQSDKGGTVSEDSHGDFDYWVVKVDKQGTVLWDKRYGGLSGDIFDSMVACKDGGFLLAGDSGSDEDNNKTSPNYGDMDYWIVKINDKGDKLWDVSYGGAVGDALNDIIALEEGGYLISGFSYSGAGGNKANMNRGDADYWVVAIDEKGDKNYEHVFGAMNAEYLYSTVSLKGNMVLAGGSQIKGQSNMYYWLILADDEGKILWQKELPNMVTEKAAITQTDGKFVWVAGSADANGGSQIWVSKLILK